MSRWPVAAAAGIMLLASLHGTSATACGYHDPTQINRGVLNWVYPDSLQVGTAIWQAQLAKFLPPGRPLSSGRSLLGYHKAILLLAELDDRLDRVASAARPSFVLLFLEPMLWTRFAVAEDGRVRAVPHVAGPSAGETVLITDEPVIRGLLERRLSLAQAKQLGLYRIYSKSGAAPDLEKWLGQTSPTNPHATTDRMQ
jgi:hypothetical protein